MYSAAARLVRRAVTAHTALPPAQPLPVAAHAAASQGRRSTNPGALSAAPSPRPWPAPHHLPRVTADCRYLCSSSSSSSAAAQHHSPQQQPPPSLFSRSPLLLGRRSLPAAQQRCWRTTAAPLHSRDSQLAMLQAAASSPTALERLVSAVPGVLDMDAKVTERFALLKQLLDADDRQLWAALCRYPNLLRSNPATLAHKLEGLEEALGIERSRLQQMVLSHPRLLSYSTTLVETKMAALRSLSAMDDDAVRTMITHTPALLSINVERMERMFRFVQGHLGCSKSEAMAIFARVPTVSTLNPEQNLAPKLAYLHQQCGMPLERLREQPSWITLSLERRIRPRHTFCQQHNIPFRFSMLRLSDERFAQRCGVEVAEYMAFWKRSLGEAADDASKKNVIDE